MVDTGRSNDSCSKAWIQIFATLFQAALQIVKSLVGFIIYICWQQTHTLASIYWKAESKQLNSHQDLIGKTTGKTEGKWRKNRCQFWKRTFHSSLIAVFFFLSFQSFLFPVGRYYRDAQYVTLRQFCPSKERCSNVIHNINTTNIKGTTLYQARHQSGCWATKKRKGRA